MSVVCPAMAQTVILVNEIPFPTPPSHFTYSFSKVPDLDWSGGVGKSMFQIPCLHVALTH